jgi:hypothetical protein
MAVPMAPAKAPDSGRPQSGRKCDALPRPEAAHGGDLEAGHPVQDGAPEADADRIDGRHEDDGSHGRRSHAEIPQGMDISQQRQFPRFEVRGEVRQIDEIPGVSGERHGNSRDSARLEYDESRPPVQEGQAPAEGVTKKDVLAPRLLEQARNLRVGERAGQCQNACQDPDGHHHARIPHGCGHVAGCQEYARSDNGPDHNHGGGKKG